MAAILTEKTQMVLRELLKTPDEEKTSAEVATATGLPPSVAAALLARLINVRYVADRRDKDGARRYRVPARFRAEAAESASFTGPVKVLRADPGRVELPQRPLVGVWRVSELRRAAAAGKVSQAFLDQVEREVAKTVKNDTRT
jgi:hypothetical protein